MKKRLMSAATVVCVMAMLCLSCVNCKVYGDTASSQFCRPEHAPKWEDIVANQVSVSDENDNLTPSFAGDPDQDSEWYVRHTYSYNSEDNLTARALPEGWLPEFVPMEIGNCNLTEYGFSVDMETFVLVYKTNGSEPANVSPESAQWYLSLPTGDYRVTGGNVSGDTYIAKYSIIQTYSDYDATTDGEKVSDDGPTPVHHGTMVDGEKASDGEPNAHVSNPDTIPE